MRRRLLIAFYGSPLVAIVAGIYFSGAISQFAFQKAFGQSFTFVDLNSHVDVTLSHAYRRPYLTFYIDYDVAPFAGGYQDLFQTADINGGVRMEFAKNTSAIVFATYEPPYGFGVQIHNLVRRDHRQHISVRALEGKYVWTDDSEMGRNIVRSPTPHFLVNHVIVGQGFDASRAFNGRIYRADFSVCEYASYRNWMIGEYIALGLFLVASLRLIIRNCL
jgi:hypothetical protein